MYTSTELNDASDNDESQSKQLGVREDILYFHRQFDTHRVDSCQQHCNHSPHVAMTSSEHNHQPRLNDNSQIPISNGTISQLAEQSFL